MSDKKRLQIYFSPEGWKALVDLMGSDGQPSPTINQVLIEFRDIKKNHQKALASGAEESEDAITLRNNVTH